MFNSIKGQLVLAILKSETDRDKLHIALVPASLDRPMTSLDNSNKESMNGR
jgi:hypothetical protein